MSIPLLMASAGRKRSTLILFGFESNSGGQVSDADASTAEKTATTAVRILNPNTLGFENLHVSVNQNLDHFNLLPHISHGWHVQLKNRAETHTFVPPPLYICEFGQGGSALSQWGIGSTYSNKMVARYNAAYSGIVSETGLTPDVYFFGSWGINDALGGTNAATFHAGYLDLLDRVNSIHPVRAYFLDIIPTAYPSYRTEIQAMASSRNNIYLQDMNGKQMQDPNHLGYLGMKAITNEKIDALSANYIP